LPAKLRRSNIEGSAGAVAEVERIVGQSRARWLRVAIRLRADSGFTRDGLMAWCEAIGVDDIFGLARDDRLIGTIAEDLAAAATESLAQGGPVRRLADLAWRTLGSWSRERRVVAKIKGSSSTCSAMARRRRPCAPISSGCGSRPSPVCCSRRCAASACAKRSLPPPPAARSRSSC
jgi:Transposase DDE domain group 1